MQRGPQAGSSITVSATQGYFSEGAASLTTSVADTTDKKELAKESAAAFQPQFQPGVSRAWEQTSMAVSPASRISSAGQV